MIPGWVGAGGVVVGSVLLLVPVGVDVPVVFVGDDVAELELPSLSTPTQMGRASPSPMPVKASLSQSEPTHGFQDLNCSIEMEKSSAMSIHATRPCSSATRVVKQVHVAMVPGYGSPMPVKQ